MKWFSLREAIAENTTWAHFITDRQVLVASHWISLRRLVVILILRLFNLLLVLEHLLLLVGLADAQRSLLLIGWISDGPAKVLLSRVWISQHNRLFAENLLIIWILGHPLIVSNLILDLRLNMTEALIHFATLLSKGWILILTLFCASSLVAVHSVALG